MIVEAPQPSVLVIDDETAIRLLLRIILEGNGYRVFQATTGQGGLIAAAEYQPELVVLDLGLPDMDGIEVLKRLREWCNVPIIILSVRHREAEKVAGLENGADDYLTKPFSSGEFLARMRAIRRLLKRTTEATGMDLVKSGPLAVNLASRSVKVNGIPVKLTRTEFKLMRLFVQHAGKVVTHSEIMEAVWGQNYAEHNNYVHVYVGRLREKIEANPAKPELLVNEPGVGYRLIKQ